MQIKIEDNRSASVFRLVGDIDMNTSPEVKNSFKRAIKEKKERIAVDLAAVDYVDSSGLATLVEILKEMRRYGGKLRLFGLSPRVTSLFEITKLNRLFDIREDEIEAVNSF